MSKLSPMKILLIYPYFIEARVLTVDDVRAVPLGVYYVAAMLKENNFDVEVLNWHDIKATPEKIEKILVEKKTGCYRLFHPAWQSVGRIGDSPDSQTN